MKQLLLVPLLLLAAPAWADDDEVRELTECRDMEELVDVFEEFDELDADRRDVVDIRPTIFMSATDGLPLPERMFARLATGEVDFPLDADGVVGGDPIATIVAAGGGELCATDPARVGTSKDDKAIKVTMGLIPQFLQRTGSHTVAELEEGADDGRKFFKKMAPGAVSFLVPKLDHMAVSHPLDDVDRLPRVQAWRGDESLGYVEMEPFDVSQLLSLDTLEDMGADRITVEGPYRLYPMPSAKQLERFGG